MNQRHADILDQQESLGGPFVQSILLHVAIAGALVVSSMSFSHSREVWGSPQTSAGSAVAVQSVKSIPLPAREGPKNPVANDTDSQVPKELAPKPQPKQQVKPPEDAIPIKSRVAKLQPRPQASHNYLKEPQRPNQVYSRDGAAAVSPMFQKAGSGQVGVGQNSTFGNQFGAYASLVVQRVTEKWQTNGLAGVRLPNVIITFDIQRDGSVRSPQIAQRSGNSTLDYSALRAVTDAGPFPPLPANFSGSSTHVELEFQLQQ